MAYKPWSRQKEEIDAYNTFLSAYHSRSSYHGFSRQGYEILNYFPTIPIRNSGKVAEPDFILYNGHTALLAEIKSSLNFDSDHEGQMRRCGSLSINDIEEYIFESGVKSETSFDGDVHHIEPFIVYDGLDQEYIDKCKSEWQNCEEDLAKIEALCPVLCQKRGERLMLGTGEFHDPSIQAWLEYGISLPSSPRTTVSLSDGLEKESVAAALCNIWGQRAVSADVTVTIKEVRERFNHRELQPGRVREAFSFLDRVGACSEVTRQKYRFSPSDQGRILNIGAILDREFGEAGEDDTEDADLYDYF